ncbi:hypothetical protein ACHAQH_003212 [Verticillium albo-atrum]
MRDPNEPKGFRPATTSPTGLFSRSRSFGAQSPAKTMFDNLKTGPWPKLSNDDSFDRDLATESGPSDLAVTVELLHPELIQPFETKAHEGAEFCFAPILQYPFQKKPRTIRKPVVRAMARETMKRKQEAVKLRKANHDTAELKEAFEKYQEKAQLPSQQSPRKKLMSEAPHPQEAVEGEFDEDWESAKAHGDYRMSWAKADIRNHLLNTGAPETRRQPSTTDFGPAPVLKRRADGTARANWIRRKQVDPDVKYLLTFPGDEMGAEKAYSLLGRKDMLSLDIVEEASNDSLVMPEDPPSTATHISEENRLARLEAAKAQLPEGYALIENADGHARIEQHDYLPTHLESDEALVEKNSSVQDEIENDDTQVRHSPSVSLCDGTDIGPSDGPSIKDEAAMLDAEGDNNGNADQVRTFKAPSVFSDTTTISASHLTSPERPSTPQAQAMPAQQVLDIDLNKDSDIFASALLQNRTSKVSSAAVSQLSFTTPQPSSPPPSMKSQGPGIENDSRWSPLAESPTPFGTPSITSAKPAHSSMSVSSQPDDEQQKRSGVFSPIEALANLVSPIQEMPDTRVVMGQNEDRFFIRFKLPDEFAENFLEQAKHFELDNTLKQEDQADEEELESETIPQELDEEPVDGTIKIISEDDPRDLLRQFVTKHQAGKAKPSAATFSNEAAPHPAVEDAMVKTDLPTETAPIFPAESPRTPEAGAERSPMWIETPTFSMASDQPVAETPTRSSSTKKRRRTPLGELDANSPSPVKAKAGKRKMADGDDGGHMDLEKKSPEPSPKRRRGLRARKPATPGPDAAPVNSRLVRNAEKDLASTTRANTRANKSGALYPADVLAQFAEDPMGQQWKERKAVVDARAARTVKVDAKSVHWPIALASYQTFTSDDAEAEDTATPFAPAEPAPEPESEPEEPKEDERPKKSRAVKSKLPAPVGRPRRAAAPATPRPATPRAPAARRISSVVLEADEDSNAGRRPTRAAAQKTNIRMGLTATGTPVRRRPTRSTST